MREVMRRRAVQLLICLALLALYLVVVTRGRPMEWLGQ